MEKYPKIFNEEKTPEENIKRVASLPGFAEKTARSFVDYLENFRKFVEESNLTEYIETKLLKNHSSAKINKNENKSKNEDINIRENKPLENKVIVFSGFRSKKLKTAIEKMGGSVEDKMSKKTNLVLQRGEKKQEK